MNQHDMIILGLCQLTDKGRRWLARAGATGSKKAS